MYNDGDNAALAMNTGKAQSAGDTAAMDQAQAQDAFIGSQANNSSTAQTGLTNNNGAGNAQTGLANNNGGASSMANGQIVAAGAIGVQTGIGTDPVQVRVTESNDNAPIAMDEAVAQGGHDNQNAAAVGAAAIAVGENHDSPLPIHCHRVPKQQGHRLGE